MAIKKSVLTIFDLRSLIVLTFLIASNPMWINFFCLRTLHAFNPLYGWKPLSEWQFVLKLYIQVKICSVMLGLYLDCLQLFDYW